MTQNVLVIGFIAQRNLYAVGIILLLLIGLFRWIKKHPYKENPPPSITQTSEKIKTPHENY